MGTTRRGLEISSGSVEAVDAFTDEIAGLGQNVDAILQAAEAEPDSPMLQLYGAMFWLFGQTQEAMDTAGPFLKRAEELAPNMNAREQAYLAALKLWHKNDNLAALEAFESLTQKWPADMAAVKAMEFLYYVLGQQHYGPRFLHQMSLIKEPNADDPDFLAMYSFAHELSGRIDLAMDLAEKSIARRSCNPWAQHTLAHGLITKGNRDDALARMNSFVPDWQKSNRIIYCHNAWHLALVYLDHLDFDGTMGVYDEHIWGVMPDNPGEQIDAISLLWRMEMAGHPMDTALKEVANHTEKRVAEIFMPFLSAHFAYGLARVGKAEALETLLGAVNERAEAADEEARRVWKPVGRPVVEACAAYGQGDSVRAAQLFDPVMDQVTAVGGSDAQCDLFRQAYLSSLIKSGRTSDARDYWGKMTDWKTHSPLDDSWLERM